MRVLLLYNPISGSGQSATLAEKLAEQLSGVTTGSGPSLTVRTAATSLEPQASWLDPLLEETDLMVVLGGDGAVRMAAAGAMRHDVALIQYPTGTENLFARDFGMKADPTALIASIKHGQIAPIDVGYVNEELMLLCGSVGLDAEIVCELASNRRGAISHASYVRPMIRQLMRWRRSPIRVEVEVDGKSLGTSEVGNVLLANSSQYAMRLNPAREASNEDGLLDVVVMPARSMTAVVGWAIRCKRGTQMRHPSLIHAQGQEIRLQISPPGHLQLDGDLACGGALLSEVVARVEPSALRVLRPSSENAQI